MSKWPVWTPFVLGGVALLSIWATKSPTETHALGGPPRPPPDEPTTAPLPLNPADVARRLSEFKQQAALDITAYQGQEALLEKLAADLHTIGDASGETAVRNALLTLSTIPKK